MVEGYNSDNNEKKKHTPRHAPMSLMTRGSAWRAASESRKASRVRRAKTSIGVRAYSC